MAFPLSVYKKKEKKAAEIGRELRAGALVEGSVRKAEKKMAIYRRSHGILLAAPRFSHAPAPTGGIHDDLAWAFLMALYVVRTWITGPGIWAIRLY